MLKELADAIRKGSTLHSQGTGFFVQEKDGETFTCAMGAAFEALFGTLPHPSVLSKVAYPVLSSCGIKHHKMIKHPELGGERSPVFTVVTDLNDGGWTREGIADYLESLPEE